METRSYTWIDKSGWGEGPWQAEPDKVQYPDPETGLPCLIVRHPYGGHFCGYVGVPPGHPWHGLDRWEIAAEAHGGVNFAAACDKGVDEDKGICHVPGPGEDDHVWWVGFDCAHAYDFQPGAEPSLNLGDLPQWGAYRTVDYVKDEIARLCKQASDEVR